MTGSEKSVTTGWMRRGIQTGLPAVAGALMGIALMSLYRSSSKRNFEQEWKSYRYPEDGFKASFPSEPLLSKHTLVCSEGRFEMCMHMAKLDGTLFSVNVCEYAATGANRSLDAIFEEAEKAAASMVKCHLACKTRVTLGIYPGVATESENKDWHFSDRIYHVGSTMYHMLVVRPVSEPCTDVVRFFDSFQLIARVNL
jgi:hypothetical protein